MIERSLASGSFETSKNFFHNSSLHNFRDGIEHIKRDGLSRLLTLAKNKEFNVLVVCSLDKFSSLYWLQAAIKKFFRDAKITTYKIDKHPVVDKTFEKVLDETICLHY